MARLKAAIFSLRDVVVRSGTVDAQLISEVGKLVGWLRQADVQPVFVSNHDWNVKMPDGSTKDLKSVLSQQWGDMPWYIASNGDIVLSPRARHGETSRWGCYFLGSIACR
jgi:hypothetical protein